MVTARVQFLWGEVQIATEASVGLARRAERQAGRAQLRIG